MTADIADQRAERIRTYQSTTKERLLILTRLDIRDGKRAEHSFGDCRFQAYANQIDAGFRTNEHGFRLSHLLRYDWVTYPHLSPRLSF